MTSKSRFVAASAALAAVAVAMMAAAAGYRVGTGRWPDLVALTAASLGSEFVTAAPMALGPTGEAGADAPRVAESPSKEGGPTVGSGSGSGGHANHDAATDENPSAEAPGVAAQPSKLPGEGGGRKLLYYRNPMGLPDTSPHPKKDWMGMDYIAVYEGEEPTNDSTIKVSLDRVQRAGVRSEPAAMRPIGRPVRAPGVAKPDERTLRSITLRFDGYIEKLYANVKGQWVKAGEPLFEIYSPEVVSAVIDYRRQFATTRNRARGDAEQLDRIVAQRFRNLELPSGLMNELRETGTLPDRIAWPSPATGVVIAKDVVEGQLVRTGEELYRLTDLASIWVMADVAEQDLAHVKLGASAKLKFRALPGETFEGRVTFILHELNAATRTGQVRVEVKNPAHRILHEMYADVEIEAGSGDERRLVVPASALIDSGTRQVVIVDKGEGRFEPRAVVPGIRGDDDVEITEGLSAGERVVVSASFLIDAESNIKAALEAFAPVTDAPKENAGP